MNFAPAKKLKRKPAIFTLLVVLILTASLLGGCSDNPASPTPAATELPLPSTPGGLNLTTPDALQQQLDRRQKLFLRLHQPVPPVRPHSYQALYRPSLPFRRPVVTLTPLNCWQATPARTRLPTTSPNLCVPLPSRLTTKCWWLPTKATPG